MKFTWLTYRLAIRRSRKLEYELFCQHHGAYRGPRSWWRQKNHTNALIMRRRIRERDLT